MQWGVTSESEALKAFTTQNGLQVVESGVWLDESTLLGVSPDGLVENDSVLKAKCPYTERNSTIEEALKSSSFCLEKKDGKIVLRRITSIGTKSRAICFAPNKKKMLLCSLDINGLCFFGNPQG